MTQASEALVEYAGGCSRASLNLVSVGNDKKSVVQQVDDTVFVVGQDDFGVAKYSIAGWLAGAERGDPLVIDCDDALQAWELLQHLRADCLVWQCAGCDAWIFTSNRPRIGILRCAISGDAGIDFRHADRHVGDDE